MGLGTAVDPLRHTLAASKRPCWSQIAKGEPQADSSRTRKQKKKTKKKKKKKTESQREQNKKET